MSYPLRAFSSTRCNITVAVVFVGLHSGAVLAQKAVPRDPAEPQQGRPQPRLAPRPTGVVARASVDEKSMRALIEHLVACGTRLSLSSWTDPKRGIGCARDHIAARFQEIAKDSGGKLKVTVDKFDAMAFEHLLDLRQCGRSRLGKAAVDVVHRRR